MRVRFTRAELSELRKLANAANRVGLYHNVFSTGTVHVDVPRLIRLKNLARCVGSILRKKSARKK